MRRPRLVNALDSRSEGKLLVSLCTTTCAGAVRCLRESATRIISSHCSSTMLRSAGLGEEWREHAVVDKSVNPIQLLVLEVPDTRHKVEPQQVTEGKDILGNAVGIRRMLTNLQNRVVF